MAALNYSVVQHPKPGNRVSGDAWLVLEREEGILIAMADGLGSGEPAWEAAEAAVQCLRRATEWEVSRLLEACHEALIPSRGAALALLLIEPWRAHLACVIVGNVEVRASQNSQIKPIPSNGIVGAHYHPLRPFSCRYTPGELVAIHTDGVSKAFDFDLAIARVGPQPQTLAHHLVHHFSRPNDDVTMLVAELP